MRTVIKRMFALSLCIMMAVLASPAYAEVIAAERDTYWADLDFSELAYYDYSLEDFQKLYDEITTAIAKEESQDVIDGLSNELNDMYKAVYSNCTLAYYKWSNNYYNEEYMNNYYQYLDFQTQVFNMKYESNQNPSDSESVEIRTKINECIRKYNEATIADYFVDYQGSKVNYDDINTIEENGEISEIEINKLWTQYWEKHDADVSQAFIDVINARNEYARLMGYQDYYEFYYNNYKSYTLEQMEVLSEIVYDKFIPLFVDLVNYADNSSYSQIVVPLSGNRMIDTTYQALTKMDDQLLEPMDYMVEHELYDIEYTGQKSTQFHGMVYLLEKQPTILLELNSMNDLFDLLAFQHEMGHYENVYLSHALYGEGAYKEIMSCTLPLLLSEEMDGLFTEEEQIKIINDNIFMNLRNIVEGPCYYKFERKLYQDNDLTKDDISKYYYDCFHEYERKENKEHRLDTWLYKETVINMSMYWETYSFAGLIGTQLWMEYEENKEEAVQIYKRFLNNSYGTDYITAVQNSGLQNPLTSFDSDKMCEFLQNKFIYGPLIDRNTENSNTEVPDKEKESQGLELSAADTADKDMRASQINENMNSDIDTTANTGEDNKNSLLYLVFAMSCIGISLITLKKKQVSDKA